MTYKPQGATSLVVVLLFVIMLLCLSNILMADPVTTPTPKPIPPLRSAGQLAVVYDVPGMADVNIQPNIDYVTPLKKTHRLDIYTSDTTTKAPVVVLIHGSVQANANFKDLAPYTSWGRLIAASNLAAVTFNWDHPESSDLIALFAYLRDNEHDLNIDLSKMCIVAFSGGVDPTLALIEAGELGEIACFVGYYGDYTLSTAGLDTIDADTFPEVLLLHGAKDEIISLKEPQSYLEETLALDLPVRLLIHSQGVHAFDLRNDDDESRQLIEASLDFIKSNLLPSPDTKQR
jgi:dienelactone hydrolase